MDVVRILSRIRKNGTVQVAMSDVEMNCTTFAVTRPPNHGTFVSVEVPSADKGVASKNFVDFNIFVNGDYVFLRSSLVTWS